MLHAALDLAGDIAANTAPLSVAISKRILWEAATMSVPEALRIEGKLFPFAARHDDAREGIAAFMEKREPKWSGRPSTEMPAWPD